MEILLAQGGRAFAALPVRIIANLTLADCASAHRSKDAFSAESKPLDETETRLSSQIVESVVFVTLKPRNADFSAVATSKFVTGALTGSSAMLAQGFHSLVDTGNEVLLFIGLKRSRHIADEGHAFG